LALGLLNLCTSSVARVVERKQNHNNRLPGLIDIHTHLLPQIDDGPGELGVSLQMLGQAQAAGIRVVIATPHLYFYHKLSDSHASATQKIKELKQAAAAKGISIQIELGYEVFLHPDLSLLPDLEKLTLAGSRYLIVELATGQIPGYIEQACFELLVNGFTPILAHPERNLLSSSQLSMLQKLVSAGTKLQVEAASLVGLNGKYLKRACLLLLQENLVEYIASDAHNTKRNFLPMQQAYREIEKQYGEQRALRLFCENQNKILTIQSVQTHLNFVKEDAQRS
jgi:protein-tyrosine phosphatase